MREIKFRGYSKSLQKFIYGGISIFEDEATIFDVNDMTNSAIEVELDSIGQFTGLEDKKEFNIYEGDILELPNGTTGVVEWLECGFVLRLKGETIWQNLLFNVVKHYSVVGNIYGCK